MLESASLQFTTGFVVVWLFSRFVSYIRSPLRKIPTIGYDGPLAYLTAIRSVTGMQSLIQEGYKKYHGKAFKVAMPDRWVVVVTGSEMVEQIWRASDDELSFIEASGELLQTEWTMGPSIQNDPYHVAVVRGVMTRSLGDAFPDICDEVRCALKDLIPPSHSEWVKIPAMGTIMQIVCRTSNRLFVGLPLCRDGDYLDLNTKFTTSVFLSAQFINLFPKFLKSFVARSLTNVPGQIKRGMRHLEPVLLERLEKQRLYGKNWTGKPNDILSWLIDEAVGNPERLSIRELTLRILTLNFSAIHTTTFTFTFALFFVAAHPQLAHPLREEVQRVTREHGWTKAAMDKLTKMDSFLKESQRLTGLGSTVVSRVSLKDFTFCDGTAVPAGTYISVPTYSIHTDDAIYPNPGEFVPFRFDDLQDRYNPRSVKPQLVTTSPEYLLFGHGRHACPGRFFAVNEFKIILSHLLLQYDIKLENEGVLPEPIWYGPQLVPNKAIQVMLKERKV